MTSGGWLITSIAMLCISSAETGSRSYCLFLTSATNSGSLSVAMKASRRARDSSGDMPGGANIGRPKPPADRIAVAAPVRGGSRAMKLPISYARQCSSPRSTARSIFPLISGDEFELEAESFFDNPDDRCDHEVGLHADFPADEIWNELELGPLDLKTLWCGYNLGCWSEEDEENAELITSANYKEVGKKLMK